MNTNYQTHIKLIFILISLLTLPACLSKQYSISSFAIKNKQIPLFIQMPQNPLAFDNVSSLIYTTFHQHFLNVGYTLVDNASQGYTIRTRVKGLDPHQKLVSPDVILVHSYVHLDIECELLNFKQEVVATNKFSFSTIVSKPRNPVLTNDFTFYAYKKMLRRAAPKIERFFRPFLLEAFDKD